MYVQYDTLVLLQIYFNEFSVSKFKVKEVGLAFSASIWVCPSASTGYIFWSVSCLRFPTSGFCGRWHSCTYQEATWWGWLSYNRKGFPSLNVQVLIEPCLVCFIEYVHYVEALQLCNIMYHFMYLLLVNKEIKTYCYIYQYCLVYIILEKIIKYTSK